MIIGDMDRSYFTFMVVIFYFAFETCYLNSKMKDKMGKIMFFKLKSIIFVDLNLLFLPCLGHR